MPVTRHPADFELPLDAEVDLCGDADVSDRLSDDVLSKLHELCGANTDRDRFRARLVTIFRRYDHYRIRADETPRKVVRRRLERIEKTVTQLLTLLDESPGDIAGSLEARLNTESWNKWSARVESFWTEPLPKPTELDRIIFDLSQLLRASRAELKFLHSLLGTPRKKQNAPLEQLILDLAGTYSFARREDPKSQTYYDPASGAYRGRFFAYVKAALDWYAPRGYFSDGALGKQIIRVLSEDDEKDTKGSN